MTNREALITARAEMVADGLQDQPANLADILDYLAIAGVPGASYYYGILCGGPSVAKNRRSANKVLAEIRP